MNAWLPLLPVVVPFATALLSFAARHNRAAELATSLAGAMALFAAAIALLAAVWDTGVLAVQLGDWAAPFGITFVADRFSAIMVVIAGLTGSAIAVYAAVDIDDSRRRLTFHPLYHIMLGGICGAFLTGDIFNLYVWFEVMLIASFGLLVLGGDRAQIDGAVKYVAVNFVATISLLMAIGLLYGLTGTLNMADLHLRVPAVADEGLVVAVAMLFMVAFGIKAALFPLFFWLPASYHTPPVAVSAIFAALLTKVGVYALIRVFTIVFPPGVGMVDDVLLVVAAATMVTGVLGAAAQSEVHRILSFHIVSQVGYTILGLALFTPLGLLAGIFYLIHNIMAKTNLILIGGVVRRIGGSFDLAALGSLYRERPGLALLFLISALSLAGMPPLSGFWAKLLVIQASFSVEQYLLGAVAIAVGLLTLYSMTKIWVQAFWKPRPDVVAALPRSPGRVQLALLLAPIVGFAAITVTLGLWAEPFIAFAGRAAADLLDPASYVAAVLGDRVAEARP